MSNFNREEYISKYAMKTGDKAAPVIGVSAVIGAGMGALVSRQKSLTAIRENGDRRMASAYENLSRAYEKQQVTMNQDLERLGKPTKKIIYGTEIYQADKDYQNALNKTKRLSERLRSAPSMLKGKIRKGMIKGGVRGALGGALIGGTILGYNRVMDKIEEVPRT
jgi:hypothetical protein